MWGPGFVADLQKASIYTRSVFLSASTPDEPLAFRYIGEPTVGFFGRDWAREQLGRPHLSDPYSTFAAAIDAEYREAIEGGEPVYNRLVVDGLANPFIYSHLLLGYALPSGRRAVLVLVDY